MEKINCNENTLIFFLQKVAQAHNVEFVNSMDEDGQVLLKSEDVPVVSDVKSVVEAFCLPTSENVEVGWGYTTVYISDLVEEGRFRNEVDIQTLSMALPKGVVKINESQLKKVISESIKMALSESKSINEISDKLLARARDAAFRDMITNWNNDKIRTKREKQRKNFSHELVKREQEQRDSVCPSVPESELKNMPKGTYVVMDGIGRNPINGDFMTRYSGHAGTKEQCKEYIKRFYDLDADWEFLPSILSYDTILLAEDYLKNH